MKTHIAEGVILPHLRLIIEWHISLQDYPLKSTVKGPAGLIYHAMHQHPNIQIQQIVIYTEDNPYIIIITIDTDAIGTDGADDESF